jgi:predicted transcriptional regulator
VISVYLNIVHVPPTLPSLGLARFMAALPPLVILVSFIAVSRRIEESARHDKAIFSYQQIQQAITDKKRQLDEMAVTKRRELDNLIAAKRRELDEMTVTKTDESNKLASEIERLTSEKAALTVELTQLQSDIKAQKLTQTGVDLAKSTLQTPNLTDANTVRLTQKEEAMRQLLTYLTEHPDATLTDAADAIDRSRSTVSGYVSELSDAGVLYKNGHGWEVISS